MTRPASRTLCAGLREGQPVRLGQTHQNICDWGDRSGAFLSPVATSVARAMALTRPSGLRKAPLPFASPILFQRYFDAFALPVTLGRKTAEARGSSTFRSRVWAFSSGRTSGFSSDADSTLECRATGFAPPVSKVQEAGAGLWHLQRIGWEGRLVMVLVGPVFAILEYWEQRAASQSMLSWKKRVRRVTRVVILGTRCVILETSCVILGTWLIIYCKRRIGCSEGWGVLFCGWMVFLC